MDFSRQEEIAITQVATQQDDGAVQVLSDAQLLLVGGGVAEVGLS